MQTPDEIIAEFGLQPLNRVALTRNQIKLIQLKARLDTIEKLNDFPFVYIGGGYFRDKRVKKGNKAETLHGNEVLTKLKEFLML